MGGSTTNHRGGELLRSDFAEVRAVTAAMPSVVGRRTGGKLGERRGTFFGGSGIEGDMGVPMRFGANIHTI